VVRSKLITFFFKCRRTCWFQSGRYPLVQHSFLVRFLSESREVCTHSGMIDDGDDDDDAEDGSYDGG
jgi:hypothetical protein